MLLNKIQKEHSTIIDGGKSLFLMGRALLLLDFSGIENKLPNKQTNKNYDVVHYSMDPHKLKCLLPTVVQILVEI